MIQADIYRETMKETILLKKIKTFKIIQLIDYHQKKNQAAKDYLLNLQALSRQILLLSDLFNQFSLILLQLLKILQIELTI